MKIEIENVRSIKRAIIDTRKIALIKARNRAGKTSIINAIAAAAIGDPRPYGITKSNAHAFVRRGERRSRVELSGKGWSVAAQWPEAERTVAGDAPEPSKVVLGILDPAADMKPADLAQFIGDISGEDATVTPEDIVEECREIPSITPDHINVIKQDARYGVEHLEKKAAEREADAKRAWRAITAENFGANKARAWKHPDIELAKKFDANLDKANHALAKLRQEQPKPQFDIADLEAEKEKLRDQYIAAKNQIQIINERIQICEKELAAQVKITPCPICNGKLVINGDRIEPAPEKATFDQNKFRQATSELAELATRQAKCQQTMRSAKERANAINNTIQSIQASSQDMREKIDIDRDIDTTTKAITALKKQKSANKAMVDVDIWARVKEIAGPTGIQFKKISKCAQKIQPKFNKIAETIFGKMSKPDMVITHQGIEILSSGRAYKEMVWKSDPNSFALSIKIIFQILAAEKYPGFPILIDRFDTLEKRLQNAVLSVLADRDGHTIPAVIVATASTPPKEDKIAHAGVGLTYWIDAHGHVPQIKDL